MVSRYFQIPAHCNGVVLVIGKELAVFCTYCYTYPMLVIGSGQYSCDVIDNYLSAKQNGATIFGYIVWILQFTRLKALKMK